MATAYNMVIGTSLAVLLALLVGLFVAGVWRHLTRQFTRGGLVVFVICAWIATVEAQKRLYVDITKETGDPVPEEIVERYGCDHTFKTIQEAFDYLDYKAYSDVDILIAPGVYPAVTIHEPLPCPYDVVVQLTPYFDVTAIEGAGSVVIDGGGVTNGITYLPSDVYNENYMWCTPRQWHGIVLSNAVHGADLGCFYRCVATHCRIGFNGSYLWNCMSIGNSCAGAVGCNIENSLIAFNCAHSSDGAVGSAGVHDCEVRGSIIWGNTKDGEVSNYSALRMPTWWSAKNGFNCTEPLLDDYGDFNICEDPMFVDAAHGDYHLKMGSPCINAVDGIWYEEYHYDDEWLYPAILYSEPAMMDFDGNPRIQRMYPDIGPYEYQPTNEHQTITAPEPVEFAWIDEKCPKLLAECGGDYDKAVLMKSANPVDISLPEPLRTYYSIWESYVADLDPTDSNQTFRATIEMVNGEPIVKGDPESPNRKYTVLGKEKLSDATWQENLPGAQFFKVKVGLK